MIRKRIQTALEFQLLENGLEVKRKTVSMNGLRIYLQRRTHSINGRIVKGLRKIGKDTV